MKSNSKLYYGPLFWLAAVSFVVPLFVAATAFREVYPTTKPVPQPDVSGVDHALWDYLLKTYVENGLVDYDGMRRDHLFRTYLNQLGRCQPQKLATEAERLALLCNAYNAFVIDGVITHRIDDSVMNYKQHGKEFFDIREHILANHTISLNEIEHKMIRKRYQEPRIHVALVCAAISCPAIRREAYVGPRIAAQLEDQAYIFANNRTYVDYDATHDVVRLSPILQWYGDDWDESGGYLPWLVVRIEDEDLRNAVTRAANGEAEIVFADYNWSLNAQQPPANIVEPLGEGTTGRHRNKPAPKSEPQFGSGSIPNE